MTFSEQGSPREPVHVLYGGAHLFTADTVQKLGRIALATFNRYCASPAELALSMGFEGSDRLLSQVHDRTRRKLETEPVEDFRIDFEDGFGVRSNAEEDRYASMAAQAAAQAMSDGSLSPFFGIRTKSFQPPTKERAKRTLEIFFHDLLNSTGGVLPGNIVATLPKVATAHQVAELAQELSKIDDRFEKKIAIELMVETPAAVIGSDGRCPLREFVEAADGRCRSAHFGAYDYTSLLGISAIHQDLRHPACDHARQAMAAVLAPMDVRLVDSVTTQIPTPVHRGDDLSQEQESENRHAIDLAWKRHFGNVLYSMSNGFYQSWDLHPNQLVARFAAVNYFYLMGFDEQARRLSNYMESAAQATLTGTVFDDAASARGVVNFFMRGIGCGALTESEVRAATGSSIDRLKGFFA